LLKQIRSIAGRIFNRQSVCVYSDNYN